MDEARILDMPEGYELNIERCKTNSERRRYRLELAQRLSHFSKPEIIYSEKIWQELSEAKIRLNAVLCDPEGKCCIAESDGDREIIDGTLKDIDKVIDIMKSLNKGE